MEGDWKRELHLGVGQLQWLPQRCGYDVFARRGDGEGLRSRVDDVPDAVLHGGCWGGRERGGGRRGDQGVGRIKSSGNMKRGLLKKWS